MPVPGPGMARGRWALFATLAMALLVGSWAGSVTRAVRLALFEQEVEDVNAGHRFDHHLERRLIVMPLSDEFKPHAADPMFGKLQYGDKASLPSSIGKTIFSDRLDVPWLFEVKPAHVSSDNSPLRPPFEGRDLDHEALSQFYRRGRLQKVFVSPLDFRAPENYIFLPRWIMNDLDLRPFDLVDVSFVRIRPAELVTMQPLSESWDELIERVGDPKALLEREVNKYSSLTAGSTISIEIDGEEYPLHVRETRAEGGVAVQAVRVQDSDVRVDIDRAVLDVLAEERQKDRRRAK